LLKIAKLYFGGLQVVVRLTPAAPNFLKILAKLFLKASLKWL